MGKKKSGGQRRSRKRHEKRLERQNKIKQDRKRNNRRRKRVYFKLKTVISHIWKLAISIRIFERFIQTLTSLF